MEAGAPAPGFVFVDGFEAGNPDLWDSVLGAVELLESMKGEGDGGEGCLDPERLALRRLSPRGATGSAGAVLERR